MAKDPYLVLGIPKNADAAAIKRAFRELAKKYHPDKTKGDKAAEIKFKEINTAHDILSDADTRAKFDRGEIDASGNPVANPFAHAGANAGAQGGSRFRDFNFNAGAQQSSFNAEDIFADLFGSMKRGNGQQRRSPFDTPLKGEDIKYDLNITLFEAVRGGKRRVNLSNGKAFDVTIPPASAEGQTLRLKGLGENIPGGTAGDALVTLRIEPHGTFTLKGLNLYSDVPVSLPEAVLGAEIAVPTLDGTVNVKVPKGANTGTLLRLKGKGAANKAGQVGDQYINLKIMLPEKIDDDLSNAIEKWAKKHAYSVRK